MRENTSLSAWRRGEQTIGCWLSLANSYTAEAISKLGFDWVCIDMQHGLIDYSDLTNMLPAISNSEATPLVRVPWNEPYEIMKALALGLPVSGDQPQEEHLEVVTRIRDVCRQHKVAVGIHTSSLEYAQKYLGLGLNFVTLRSESGHMVTNAARELAAARGAQEQQRESTGY